MRHYSKVIINLPDGPDDPPYATVVIDCDVCGEEEIRIHMAHLGTVLRTLGHAVESLNDNGKMEPFGDMVPMTEENRRKVRAFLDERFPGWKGDHIRGRG